MAENELSLDEIEAIEAQPDPEPKRRVGKDSYLSRDIQGWLKAQHRIFDPEVEGGRLVCTVPNHDESERDRSKGVVVKVGQYWVCRMCFLNRRDIDG